MFQVFVLVFVTGCGLFGGDEAPPDGPPVFNPIPVGTTPPPTGDTPYVGGFLQGEFCDVQAVLQVGCVVGCHSSLVPSAGLDLETNPYNATVRNIAASGQILVEPGYPDQSFLYRKMVGDLGPNDGGVMPPSGTLDPYLSDAIRRWITSGAYNDCQPGNEPPPPPTYYTEAEPYHPPGWVDPGIHGVANNLQTDGDCRDCHGDDLAGGSAGVSCDECHDPGWRTDCVFCHGGVDNLTGAPPEDIDDSPVSYAFPEHTEHVTGGIGYSHPAYGCSQCHAQRYDVLTPGHIFDDVTAGYGELDYTGGLAPYSTYLFGTCSNNYCHGNGQADIGVATVGQTMYCYTCHPDGLVSQDNEWAQMGGLHLLHMGNAAAQCYECHSQVTDANQNILNGEYHVNGYVEVQPIGVTYNNGTCNGTCHNFNHDNDNW